MNLVRRVLALAAVVGLLAGIPTLLLGLLGVPWAHPIAWSGTLTGPALMAVLGWICWAFWAWVAVCVLIELVNVATEVRFGRPRLAVPVGSSWARPLATALLAGSSALGMAGPALAATTAAPAPIAATHTHHQATPAAPAEAGTAAAVPAELTRAMTTHHTTAPRSSHLELTVAGPQHGDHQSLWEIAENHLGDGMRWREIFHLNQHHISDPDRIYPGEVLTMPADATGITPPASSAPHAPPATPGHDAASPSSSPAPSTGGASNDSTTPAPSASASTSTSAPSTGRGTGPAAPSTGSGTTSTAAPSAPSEGSDADVSPSPDWLLPGLAVGGGAALAGAVLVALRARRRESGRARRPGEVPTPVPVDLIPVEKSVVLAGTDTADTVELVDHALRALAEATLAAGRPLPAVVAVSYTRAAMTIYLNDPLDELPEPWTPVGSLPASSWTASGTALTAADVRSHQGQAPWPLLVTIGEEPRDDVAEPTTWMLNLELAGGIIVSGDEDRVAGFIRFAAAEAATVDRCEGVRVDTVGMGQELADLGVHCHDDAGPVTGDVLASAVAMVDRTTRCLPEAATPATGRVTHPDDEDWPARLLALHADPTTAAGQELAKAWDLVNTNPATATAIILTGTPPEAGGGTRVELTPDGLLRLPDVGLTVTAPGLTANETTGIGRLLAHANSPHHRPDAAGDHDPSTVSDQPRAHHGDEVHEWPLPVAVGQSWEPFVGPTGLLPQTLTTPRFTIAPAPVTDLPQPTDLPVGFNGSHPALPVAEPLSQAPSCSDHPDTSNRGTQPDTPDQNPTIDHPDAPQTVKSPSVLPAPDEEYTASTSPDLGLIAPGVTTSIRDQVLAADPTLDDDLAAWSDPTTTRPRLALLGPVTLTAAGQYDAEIVRRKAMLIEVAAYLATRPRRAATREQMESDLNLSAGQVRKCMTYLRKWLGNTPDGQPWLPNADQSSAAGGTGLPTYQLHADVLVDTELFRRLRARGEATGPDGLNDLKTALELVTGTPFSELRPRGWTWLLDGTRLDQTALCAVVDTAHTVATALIHQGHPDQAQAVAEHALLAAPDEEIPRLDLAAAFHAQGQTRSAEHLIQDQIVNQTDYTGLPTDLSARTQELLARLHT